MHDLPKPDFLYKTPKELGIGTWERILTVRCYTPLIDALEILLKNRISALPVLNKENQVVDIYSKFDAIYLAAGGAYNNLGIPISAALTYRKEVRFR